jgi:hypothetical protein
MRSGHLQDHDKYSLLSYSMNRNETLSLARPDLGATWVSTYLPMSSGSEPPRSTMSAFDERLVRTRSIWCLDDVIMHSQTCYLRLDASNRLDRQA